MCLQIDTYTHNTSSTKMHVCTHPSPGWTKVHHGPSGSVSKALMGHVAKLWGKFVYFQKETWQKHCCCSFKLRLWATKVHKREGKPQSPSDCCEIQRDTALLSLAVSLCLWSPAYKACSSLKFLKKVKINGSEYPSQGHYIMFLWLPILHMHKSTRLN